MTSSRAVVAVIGGTLVLSYLRAFNNYPVGTLCSDDKNVPATALTPKNLTTVECLALLDKEQKRVTWKQDIGRINANDSKARVRHLEAVKARIVARRARTTNRLGRE